MMKKIFFLLSLTGGFLFGQNHQFKTAKLEWDHPAPVSKKIAIPARFSKSPLVFVSDKTEFDFTGLTYKSLKRVLLIKINTNEGKNLFHSIDLPESFDIAENAELWQQGRRSKIKTPFIYEFNINYFLARVIKPDGKVIELPLKYSANRIRWINGTGEFTDDYINRFAFDKLETGDLIEISYQADYKPDYGSNMLYFSSSWPKLSADYRFHYIAVPDHKEAKFLFSENVPDSCISFKSEPIEDHLVKVTEHINLSNLEGINYFIHAFSAKQLPHIYFNINYTQKFLNKTYYMIASLPDYQWEKIIDLSKDPKIYTKFTAGIRKFMSTLPPFEKDSDNVQFFKAFCDTLNNYKYYSANYMYYNDPVLYNVSTTDHLAKRRFSELYMNKIYEGVLEERNLPYYITSIQDKRLGDHSPFSRVHRSYEHLLVAVPHKGSYIYFVPRFHGLKYHLNELPFYYEGAVAAMFPVNFPNPEINNAGNYFKFIKTHYGTVNENVRVENCSVKVKTDSSVASLFIKENLSGQFSTIIRPLYLKDFIDSTVNPVYFKKCTDKPNASAQKIKLSSQLHEFPFRYVFNCSENISLKSAGQIDLHDWFSFAVNRQLIPEAPTHDYYADFEFTDAYNYLFEFDKPVTITNEAELSKSLNNDYFEISSALNKQSDTQYALSVMVKMKKPILPKEEAQKLVQFVDELDTINRFVIKYTKS